MVDLLFFFSSVGANPASSSSEAAPPSLPSSSLSASSSLSGAPNAFAGFAGAGTFSFPGAAKLESFGPAPPANPFPSLEPKTLPLASPPNPDVVPLPKPNPDVDLSLEASPPNPLVAGVVEVEGFAVANAPKPEVADCVVPLKMLGFVAPRLPNGEFAEAARDAKPELANAEAEVFGLSWDMLVGISLVGDFAVSSVVLESTVSDCKRKLIYGS